MKHLPTLTSPANVVLFGASGGIGGAILEHLQSDSGVKRIYAFSRTQSRVTGDKVTTANFDLTSEQSIAEAAGLAADTPLDLVFVATGILHDGDLQPEKSLRDLSAERMREVLEINTIGPALIARYFLPLLRRGHKTVFAALSARVGSIGDNRLGGWTSYRMSKAALNMLLRTLAIEQTRRSAESIVVGLHPGTVDTRLSAPFTSRVPEEKLFSAERAAGQLLAVVDGLSTADTGHVFAWDGSRIEF